MPNSNSADERRDLVVSGINFGQQPGDLPPEQLDRGQILAQLTAYSLNEATLRPKIDALKKEYETWKRRVDLAHQQGIASLASEALAQMDRVKAKLGPLVIEMRDINAMKDRLAAAGRVKHGIQIDPSAQVQAEMVNEKDIADYKMKKATEGLEAEDALAALKKKMGK